MFRLTPVEMILFLLAVVASLYFGYRGFKKVYLIIKRSQGEQRRAKRQREIDPAHIDLHGDGELVARECSQRQHCGLIEKKNAESSNDRMNKHRQSLEAD